MNENGIPVERIDIDDIPKIRELLERLYLELGEEKESLKFLSESLIDEMVRNGKTIILKTTSNNETIGLLTLTESQAIYSGGRYGSIDEMYVEPDSRGQKVGKALVKKAIEIAQGKGWNRIDVTAPTDGNASTLNFYKKNGFVFTGPKLKLVIDHLP